MVCVHEITTIPVIVNSNETRFLTGDRIMWTKMALVALLPILVGAVLILFAQSAICAADRVSATTLGASAPNATPPPISDAPKLAPQCIISSAVEGDVIVRSYPGAQFAELGFLNSDLTALGATDDGWVTVGYGERRGWLRSENLRFAGVCDSLPTVRNPMIPTAASDAEVFAVQIDRDNEGSFRNSISTPDGDVNDLLWVTIINLYNQPPNNMREFTLTLECNGTNTDSVRWGWAYRAPTMHCGEAITIPFMIGNSQQPFTITFAPNSPQSYIDYTLHISGGGVG